MVDWGTLAQWFAGLLSLFALCLSVWSAWSKQNRNEIADLYNKTNAIDTRVTRLEADVVHLPGKDMVHALQLTMAELKGQMGVIIERVSPIKAMAERLQEAELQRSSQTEKR